MALTPIPARMLHDTVEFLVVTGMDRWQEKTYQTYTVHNVHLQANVDTIKGANDTEVQTRGILFVDCTRSRPCLDLCDLQAQSLQAGDTMRARVYDAKGNLTGDYAVLTVDALPDVPAVRIHHYEVGLV